MLDRAESGQLKALVIHRCNPVINFPGGARVKAALKKLDLLVVHDMMNTETTELADYVLPSNGPGSDEGTTTNIGAGFNCVRKVCLVKLRRMCASSTAC